jgi:hypothetical protein
MDCFALHNFIGDSNLHDKAFEMCDANEYYMPRASNAAAQTKGMTR